MHPGPNCPHYKRSEAVATVVLAHHPYTTINQRQAPDRVAVKTDVDEAATMLTSHEIGLPAGGSVC